MILQVEVYSNGSYLWEQRNQALLNLYKTISSKSLKDRLEDLSTNITAETEENLSDSNQEEKEWSDYYCDYSLLDLLGLQPLCKTLVDIAEQSMDNEEDETKNEPSTDESLKKGTTPNASSELDAEVMSTTLNLTENLTENPDLTENPENLTENPDLTENSENLTENPDLTENSENLTDNPEIAPRVEFLGVEIEEDLEDKWREMARSAFYAENRTLYELFDFYSELSEAIFQCIA